jgi:superfamily II DNA or RNA helicase
VLDEVHRLKEGKSWHRAIEPLFEAAAFVLMMSGTLTRGDGNRIAFLPYTEVPACQSE